MRTRLTRTRVLAIVALGAVMATTADAQTRTRSTRRTRSTTRIPVSKEPVVTDSVVVRDSTPAPAPAPEPVVTRTESTVVTRVATPVVRMRHYGNGFYIGVAGGAGVPTSAIKNAYNTGYAIEVPIGWDAMFSPIGVRLNLGYTRLDSRTTFRSTPTSTFAALPVADPQIFSAMLDAKLRIPLTRSWYGPSSGLYVVGGGGVNHFRHYNTTFALSNPEFNDTPGTPSSSESLTRLALNAGGGLSWAFRAAEVFVESRYVTSFMPHERASYVPIILGVNFY
jgi:hypothetical protein